MSEEQKAQPIMFSNIADVSLKCGGE